jgi:hypothetical protein
MTEQSTLYVLTAAATFLVIFTIANVLILNSFMIKVRTWQGEIEKIVKESFLNIIKEIKK